MQSWEYESKLSEEEEVGSSKGVKRPKQNQLVGLGYWFSSKGVNFHICPALIFWLGREEKTKAIMGVLSSNITTPRRPPAPLPPLSKSRPRSPPFWHRLCSRLGFQKTHNFVLFVLLGLVGVLGQGVLHSPKLDYFNVFCRRGHLAKGLHAAPGECYYFRNGGREQVGMMLHVYAVVPVCFLLVLQFVPAARQRQHRRRGGGGGGRGGGGGALLHRVSGYAVLLLTSLAMGGGWLASAGSFGGAGPWRALVWVLGGMVLCGLARAMRAIWRGKVELHRAWMLRTWAWVCCVLTSLSGILLLLLLLLLFPFLLHSHYPMNGLLPLRRSPIPKPDI